MWLDQELSLLAKRRGNTADPQLFTEAGHRTRMLTTLVGDSSGLILDSSLDSFYLDDTPEQPLLLCGSLSMIPPQSRTGLP